MASIAKLIELSPNKLITVITKKATKKKEAVTSKLKVQDVCEDLQEAFSKTEMAELINIQGNKKGQHRAILDKSVANFEAMTTYEYRVQLKDGKTRRAYAQELLEPNEFLFAKSKLHADAKLYKNYALVLWIATGYYGYATIAGYSVKFSRIGREVESTTLEEAIAHKDELLAAMEWWESADRRKDVMCVLKVAKEYTKGIVYKDSKSNNIKPYIDWETAANAVVGMHMSSCDSVKNARKAKYGKELRPDEKAQFIREYIEAEQKLLGGVDSNSVREVKDICLKFETLAKQYPLFDTEKTHDIIATIRRSNFTRVTERQRQYLTRVIQDIEAYKDVKEKRKVAEEIFDVDKFFNSITGDE